MAPQPPTARCIYSWLLESACIALDELCSCIKRLCHGKSPGIGGNVADMIKDGRGLVNKFFLWLFNCMLVSHFPAHLPVGLTGYKSYLSNYRDITVSL